MDNATLFNKVRKEVENFNIDENVGRDTVIFIGCIIKEEDEGKHVSTMSAVIKGDVKAMTDMLYAAGDNSEAFKQALITAARDILLNNKRYNVQQIESSENRIFPKPVQGTPE